MMCFLMVKSGAKSPERAVRVNDDKGILPQNEQDMRTITVIRTVVNNTVTPLTFHRMIHS